MAADRATLSQTRLRWTRLLLRCAAVISLVAPVVVAERAQSAHAIGAAPVVTSLTVDGTTSRVGVGPTPRFDWIVTDEDRAEWISDFELTVILPSGTWRATNASREASPNSVTYGGPPLASSTRYAYSLRVADATGNWSLPRRGAFITGILREADWSAKWIQREASTGAFHGRFRTEFTIGRSPSLQLAVLSMSARGLVEARINGRDVDGSEALAGDQMLVPKRTTIAKRVLVRSYDVTALINRGSNAIGLEVVNGWYRTDFSGGNGGGETAANTSPAQVIAQLTLHFSDGTKAVVGTDGRWRTSAGPVVSEVPLLGEVRDQRVDAAQTGWSVPGFTSAWIAAAVATPQPTVARIADARPPIAVVSSTEPTAAQVRAVAVGPRCHPVAPWPTCPTAPSECRDLNTAGLHAGDTVVLVDVGRIVSGFVALHDVQAASGARIEIAYGQTLDSDHRVDERLTARHWGRSEHPCVIADDGSALAAVPADADRHQVDAFIANGRTETLAPAFSYKSFRYVEIRGLPLITAAQISVHEVRDAIDSGPGSAAHATLATSDADLTSVWEAARATLGNQMHGLLQDNVVRERQGWTADAHLAAEAVLETFDAGGFWQKWIDDVVADIGADPEGLYTDVHPNNVYGGPLDPVWSASLPLVAWRTYLHTGNSDILRAAWADGRGVPTLVAAYNRIASDGTSNAPNPVLSDGTVRSDDPLLMDVVPWTYSDHLTLEPNSTTVMNTAAYISVLRVSSAIAAALGQGTFSRDWDARADQVAAHFHELFWNESAGRYEGVSPDQIYGPDAVAEKFVAAQTTQVMGVASSVGGVTSGLDLVPLNGSCSESECPIARAISDATTTGRLTTGIVGTQSMFRALVLLGLADVGQRLLLGPDNYLPMVSQSGAISESWPVNVGHAGISRDQPALAAGPIEWVTSGLAGIRPSAAGPGFLSFSLQPLLPTGLEWVDLHLQTVRGTVRSAWHRTSTGVRFEVSVPVGSTATMTLPPASADQAQSQQAVSVDGATVVGGTGQPASVPAGVEVLSMQNGSAVLRIGSGTYVIETSVSKGVTPMSRNLAMQRPVTVSSSTGISQWSAANLVDGLTSSTAEAIGWHAQLGLPSPTSTQTITVDLGQVADISRIRVWPAQPPGYPSGWYFPRRYVVEVSDSPDFPSASTVTVASSGVVAEHPSTAQDHPLSAVSARYVRLRTTELRSEGSSYSAAIGEIEVLSAES